MGLPKPPQPDLVGASEHFQALRCLIWPFSGRSYSVSGFEFDLLPLSASVADPEMVQGESAGEKSIGLVNGEQYPRSSTKMPGQLSVRFRYRSDRWTPGMCPGFRRR